MTSANLIFAFTFMEKQTNKNPVGKHLLLFKKILYLKAKIKKSVIVYTAQQLYVQSAALVRLFCKPVKAER